MAVDDETRLEALSRLQPILDEAVGGRTEGHVCPFCERATLEVEVLDQAVVRVTCPDCGMTFEGHLA